jgi:hypothetical protein
MIANHEEVLAYLREMRKRGDEQASKLLDTNKQIALDGINTDVLCFFENYGARGLTDDLPFITKRNLFDLCDIVKSLDESQFKDHAEYMDVMHEIFVSFGSRILEEWMELVV